MKRVTVIKTLLWQSGAVSREVATLPAEPDVHQQAEKIVSSVGQTYVPLGHGEPAKVVLVGVYDSDNFISFDGIDDLVECDETNAF